MEERGKKTQIYLAVAYVVLPLKHDSIDITIPQGTTKIFQLIDPSPLLPPFPQMVVHLSWAHCLPTVLLKCFGHIVNIFVLEDLVRPTTITNKLSHPSKNKTRGVVVSSHGPSTLGSSNMSCTYNSCTSTSQSS